MKNNSTFLMLLVIAATIFGCTSNSKSNTDNSSKQLNATYDRVIKSGTIRVGYIPYAPAVIEDPNTKQLSGIIHDILAQAGNNLGLKVQFTEEEAWGSMIEAIKAGRVDIVCTAVFPNSQRAKLVEFTTPFYFSPIKAYVKAGNNAFNGNINSINLSNVTLATLDGELTSVIAKQKFPNAKTHSLTQSSDVSQLLLEVATGKADVTFVEPIIASEFNKNNQNKVQEVSNVSSVLISPNVMIVNKGETEFLTMLNNAFDEIENNGITDQIIDKYEPYPNSFYRLALPYRTTK